MRSPRRPGPGRQSAAGFTLIEIMIAMVIMALGLFSVLQLQVITVRGNAYARETTEAYELAQAVAEDFRGQALNWVNPGQTYDMLYYGGGFLDPALSANPTCTDFGVNDLLAVPMLHGQAIAGGTGFGDAELINVLGERASDGAPRAIYRVHYLMHQQALAVEHPNDLITRVTVFVSWDNKDHGDPNADWNSDDAAGFFTRHMVSTTLYLNPVR